MKICIVTASTDPERAKRCILSWGLGPQDAFVGVVNGRPWEPNMTPSDITGPLKRNWLLSDEYLGTVPAFRLGVDFALEQTDADVIACLHDDLLITESAVEQAPWTERVLRYFERKPEIGLAGFGGALGLGDQDIYRKPYAPEQLARRHFRSNLVDAEAHGIRSLLAEKVACLDGFSQIGRRAFWDGQIRPEGQRSGFLPRPWTHLENLGLKHHIYDGALGCLAKRYGWETWYLPVACRHFGGVTAVGDSGYGDWAFAQHPDGDRGFWEDGHKIVYGEFRDVLPLGL